MFTFVQQLKCKLNLLKTVTSQCYCTVIRTYKSGKQIRIQNRRILGQKNLKISQGSKIKARQLFGGKNTQSSVINITWLSTIQSLRQEHKNYYMKMKLW